MSSRRKFLKTGLTGLAGIQLLPALHAFAGARVQHSEISKRPAVKLRFALASDGHYAQPGVDSDQQYSDLIKWLTKEHEQHHLDFVIVNGDLVHDRPDLLQKVKTEYLEKLPVPFHTLPGNHDHADSDTWKKVFGYDYNYTLEFGDTGFVMGNTSNTKGDFLCPDNVFLKASLEKLKSKPIVFVVLHIPPHQWLPEESSIFANCAETIALLHSYANVKAVFHGHDHTLDGLRYTDKLPHFFDAHFGGNWGTTYKGYRIVEVSDDHKITTYQVNASQNPTMNSTEL